jgi:hypothetical protein
MTDPVRPAGATNGSTAPPVKRLSTKIVIVLVALALIPAGLLIANLATRPKAQPILDCERWVRTEIVAPAMLKWSGETWSEDRAEVTGTVDAHITSGGPERITFRCSMAKNTTGDWIVSAGFVDD